MGVTGSNAKTKQAGNGNSLVDQVINPLKDTINQEVTKLKSEIDTDRQDITKFKETVHNRLDEINTKMDEGLKAGENVIYARAKSGKPDRFIMHGDFKGMWEFCHKIALAEKHGWQDPDPRLTKLRKAMDEEKAAGDGLLSTIPDAGGTLVPIGFRQELMSLTQERSTILQRANIIPMETASVEIPYMSGFDESGGFVHGGVKWQWTTEVEAKPASEPKFGKIQLTLHELSGLAKVSNRILQDSPISLEPVLRNAFADGLVFQLTKAFLSGTGAGQPLGILNAPALVQITRNTASEINYQDIVNAYAQQWSNSGIWMANRSEVFPQLAFMKTGTTAGDAPVYLPANQAAGQPFNSLMGDPIEWCKHCENLGTKGDLIYADWSQYLIGQRSGQAGPQFDTSMHLFFDTNQMAFRFIFEIDAQPWWPTSVTQPKSSKKISPFIAIAA